MEMEEIIRLYEDLKFEEALAALDKLETPFPSAIKMFIHFIIGKFEEAIDIGENYLSAHPDIDQKDRLLFHAYLSMIYPRIKDFDAMDYHSGQITKHIQEIEFVSTDFFDRFLEAAVTASRIWTNYYRRNYPEVIELSSKFFEDIMQLNRDFGVYFILEVAGIKALIAWIFFLWGDLKQAESILVETIAIAKEHNNPYGLARAKKELGLIHWNQNRPEEALEELDESREFFATLEGRKHVFEIIAYQLMIAIELNRPDLKQQYLDVLEMLSEVDLSKTQTDYQTFLKVIMLKQSERAADIVRAQSLLQDLYDDSNLELKLKLLSGMQLADTYVWEMQAMNSESQFKVLSNLLQDLREMTEDLGNSIFYLDTILLESRLLLAQLKFDEALQLLEEAENFANLKNFKNYISKIRENKAKITSEIAEWQHAIEHNSSVLSRLKQSQIESYINKAMKHVATLSDDN